MEGSLRQAGNKLRITAQLANAEWGAHLSTETLSQNWQTEDIFTVQDEVTETWFTQLRTSMAYWLE